MNHTTNFENLEDPHALRRERQKRPRMRKHGQNLKQLSNRGVLRIVKVTRKPKK